MASSVPENIALLGLVVRTLPYTVQDGIVKSELNLTCSIEELNTLRDNIKEQLKSLPESASEYQKGDLTDDLYFIDNVIINLENAST